MRTRLLSLWIMLFLGPAHAQERYALPDPKLTPGAVAETRGYHEICDLKVPKRKPIKACTYRRYGMEDKGLHEADHLIPLELGGKDVCDNLWPQKWAEADAKDQCEDAIHAIYCHGPEPRPKLRDLQAAFAKDWISLCRQYGALR